MTLRAYSKNTIGLILLLVFSLFISSCATTGPGVSRSEIDARTQILQAKAAEFKSKQIRRVQAVSERIIGFLPEEDRVKLKGLKYDVSDESTINASVRPGKMAVNYGMLRFTESDDELAVVLAHEIAHLIKGHYGKKLATNVLATAVGVAAGAALEGVTQGSGVGGMVSEGLAKGISGGFSRDLEREADYYGFQYAYLAGFDVQNGAGIWERFAIEAPKTMIADLFSTHPASPERLIRAEKILNELKIQGVQPAVFNRASPSPLVVQNSRVFQKVISVPVGIAVNAAQASGAPLGGALSLTNDHQTKPSNTDTALKAKEVSEDQNQNEEKQELEDLRRQVETLRAQLKKEEAAMRQSALKTAEFERILLEAKEAAKELRYAEFGIQDMGLAKKVTNMWIAKKVTGEQRIFPLSQGSVDWFVQYDQWSLNSWKALALKHRTYRIYWYSPNGKLYSEQDFIQSRVRSDFAKATLQWDPALGVYLAGNWLMRVFEDGKLIDERTFELIR